MEKQGSQNVPAVRGHMLHLTKGVWNTKTGIQATCGQQPKTYASIVSQNTLPQPKTTAENSEQLTKFVANVVIQITQPHVFYPNPKQDTPDLKSSMCRKVSNAAKTILNVNIT